jgi:hypothetical protein
MLDSGNWRPCSPKNNDFLCTEFPFALQLTPELTGAEGGPFNDLLGYGRLKLALLHKAKSSKDFIIVVGSANDILKLRKNEITKANDLNFKSTR